MMRKSNAVRRGTPAMSLALLLALGACSSEPAPRNEGLSTGPAAPQHVEARVEPAAETTPATKTPEPAGKPAREMIGLEGLADLKIGEPVPQGSSWRSRGAQIGDGCRTISSPEHPGTYAIVEGDRVRRITVRQGSDIQVAEGIGVGTAARAVAAAFPGFREEPHKYVAAPAKYLTAPTPAPGAPGLRFEIGDDDKVSMFHVGVMPTLAYVEGCS